MSAPKAMSSQPTSLWLSSRAGPAVCRGVEVDEVVVLRRGVRDDLRPEVEGVKEAVHPHHHQQEQYRVEQ